MEFATRKDIERAQNLNWRGSTFCPMGGDIAISNANKMAKLIKNKTKILGRFEAVAREWNDPMILRPFIEKILELYPNSKYTRAYHQGYHDGRYSMSPGRQYNGNSVERLIYHFRFSEGRRRG